MKTLRKVATALSYLWVMVFDLLVLLCVANVTMKTCIDLGLPDAAAWLIGIAMSFVVFGHLKFRHRLRQVESSFQLKPIRTDKDHARALAQVDRLWSAKPGTPQGDQLEILAVLIDSYEQDYFAGLDKDKPQAEQDPAKESEEEYHFIKYGDTSEPPKE